jgi:NADPH-dependent 2,4-dienoyl-CoA reductase/sulfur reductase-like enzyme
MDSSSTSDHPAASGASSTTGFGFAKVAPLNSTGIKVIIVGAGFAGLACAIECKRKGHDVVILEKFKELKQLGECVC